jgi:hypothetical protein
MEPIKKIKRLLNKEPRHEFDPVVFIRQATEIMDEACLPGAEYDPRCHEKAQDACNAYGGIALMLLQNGLKSAAESLLTSAWKKFASIQKHENRQIYRAALGFYLAKVYLQLDDKGAAIRWALLTQADDILWEHHSDGGGGKQMLLTILSMTENELSSLNEIARNKLLSVRSGKQENWMIPAAFAEDTVVAFFLANPEASHLLALDSDQTQFPVTPSYLCSLLESVQDGHKTTTEKGDALEDLATYLFMLIPALCPRRNVKDIYNTFETDIVIRNLIRKSDPITDIFGRHFLVECKNWDNPVGVADVGYFLYRMRLTHVKAGIIFAKTGITGTQEDERAARGIIRKAFHEDGSLCIVIKEKDLTSLLTQHLSFVSLLIERVERIRFGKARKR